MELHGRHWLRTDTYGIIPRRGSPFRSERSPDNDDDDELYISPFLKRRTAFAIAKVLDVSRENI